MKKQERAIMEMANGLDTQLKADSTIYAGNNEFEDGVDTFRTAKQVSEDALELAYPDHRKYSADKRAAKIELATNMFILCGTAYVKLKKAKLISLAKSLARTKSAYLLIADTECATLAKAMHKIMLDNIVAIDSPSITAEVLARLLKEIEAFSELQGTSLTERENSPVHTKSFKDSLPPLLESVEDLQGLLGVYLKPNPAFYERIMVTSTIPTVHVIHTYIIITAILKSTGKPAPGITFALAKAKKTGTTDRDGMLKFDEVRSGEDVLTGTSDGKEVVYKKVKIKRSTTNEWEVVIESM